MQCILLTFTLFNLSLYHPFLLSLYICYVLINLVVTKKKKEAYPHSLSDLFLPFFIYFSLKAKRLSVVCVRHFVSTGWLQKPSYVYIFLCVLLLLCFILHFIKLKQCAFCVCMFSMLVLRPFY